MIEKLNYLGHFWHSETIFGVITDLCEVVICLVLPVASRLTIDSEWKRITTLMIFDWKIEFFRSFLALWDYLGVITDLCEVVICLVLPVASRLTIDSEWKRLTTLIIFDWIIEFFRSFLALWDYFGVITDLCEVVDCLVLPVTSRLTIDSEWKRLTTLIIFDWKIEFFRSFLALWDYFWSHNWLMFCLVLPVASRLTIDSEWKRFTILLIFD